ncbi:type III-B CRISPR module RAMP protein Cmr6 [Hugenholtzia roseola]|uniref:type III-B CRISPR module RAMP protein Cmr6 n=1 Tax=Hugenholtzia roseola TaxID=1002 RepID=UPI00047BE19C|nr:type III-B CRISPR module RAMP protein Cmr6 [Hugenholtzia roseola]
MAINFALALNKPHRDNHKNWTIQQGANLKKLSDRFFTKDNNGVIIKKELDNFPFQGVDFAALEKKQVSAVKSLCGEKYGFIDFEPDWRFVVGLGGASVYETSITLHHIYGIPYIPATSIKGVVRSWYLLDNYYDKKQEMEGYAIQEDEVFCRTFGCPKDLKVGDKTFKSILKHKGESSEFEGNIIFFDAFPLTAPKLKLDIMTPHYQPYYSDNEGKKPPADYYSPTPIPFLTVEKTVFRMYFGVKKEANKEFVTTTRSWLEKALNEKGIGAKTAVGYGYQKVEKIEKERPKEPTSDNFEPQEGAELTVRVEQLSGGVPLAVLPKKMDYRKIDKAPSDIKVGDKVKVKCRMNAKGKFDYFIFISKET